MGILAAFMVPHPPMIIPSVGQGSEQQIEATTAAYKQVATEIASLQPETIIISSPHATMYRDYFHISPGAKARGSFGNFRAPQVKFQEEYDTELVKKIVQLAAEQNFPAGTRGQLEPSLDHGTMVPLWFIRQRYSGFRIVRVGLSGLPLRDHYVLGQIIQQAVKETSRKTVYIASGDLSHKLQSYGPYGFAPEGPEYDRKIMDVCSRAAFDELLDFDEDFCDRAAECGHRSFTIMSGVFDGIAVEAKQLSHEDITGVGYGICTFYPNGKDDQRHFLNKQHPSTPEEGDAWVRLARQSIKSYVTKREIISVPDNLPSELIETRAGAFVSIHKNGQLRGCIGTIAPTKETLAEEIIYNAVSASTRDPRFEPITVEELDGLEINVDVLGAAEEIDSKAQLDVKRYGVIVSHGFRRGLLLPDLEGVDTVDQQISIARQKAGISPHEPIKLQRFEVIRHY